MVVTVIRELLRRHPDLPPERIDEVAIAATTQIGDQGLTLGRIAAILAGLPRSVPGYSIDRMCAGAMTAVTTVAGGIAFGAYDVAIAGGVEHMGHHPMGEGADPNPRFVVREAGRPVRAEHGLDRREPARPLPAPDQGSGPTPSPPPARPELAKALRRRQDPARPGAGRHPLRRARLGPGRQGRDRPPGNNCRGAGRAAHAVPAARPGHRRERRWPDRRRDGLPARRLRRGRRARPARSGCAWSATASPASTRRSWASDRSRPPRGPCKATGLTIDDIGLFELNEAFAVQVLAFLDHFGLADDDPSGSTSTVARSRSGHPLASSGVRLMTQLARQFADHPEVQLRAHRDVRRTWTGRHGDLGEPALHRSPFVTAQTAWYSRRGRYAGPRPLSRRARSAGRDRAHHARQRTRSHAAVHLRAGRRCRASPPHWTRSRPTSRG